MAVRLSEEELGFFARIEELDDVNCRIFTEFVLTAFPDCDGMYAAQWAYRFSRGMALSRADSANRVVLRQIAEKHTDDIDLWILSQSTTW